MDKKVAKRPIRPGILVSTLVGGFLLGFASVACSYERAYEKTPVDKVALKVIPSSKVLITEGKGNYFTQDNGLFMRLFRYIKGNDVEMTTPVEASIKNANMVFYVGRKDAGKDLKDQDMVKVKERDTRLVVALGARGAYTEKNFTKTKAALVSWLKKQKNIKSTGEAYAVFWDGPYMPGFLKRFEVHIPVEDADRSVDGQDDQDSEPEGSASAPVSEQPKPSGSSVKGS